MSYLPVPNNLTLNPPDDENHESEDEKAQQVPDGWHGGPKTLERGPLLHILSIIWNVVLTLGPVYFIFLAFLACPLNDQALSAYGERLRNLNLVSPTLYPILFAAIASRFYKNLARWRLEKRNGIRLATLEQIFGSQSLAGCIERLIFARTHLALGFLILLTWSLSPLGGQSAARLLSVQGTQATGVIYYVHPGYQDSWFEGENGIDDAALFTNALYVSSLLSSQNQMAQPRDLWGFPKIPQLPSKSKEDVVYNIDSDALSSGNAHYASMLGQMIQGLNFIDGNSSYSFATEFSYLDFECKLLNGNISYSASDDYLTEAELNLTIIAPSSYGQGLGTFVASMHLLDTTLSSNEATPDNTAPAYMLYASQVREEDKNTGFVLFNCSVHPIVVKTWMKCGPLPTSTSCEAIRHQRVSDKQKVNHFRDQLIPSSKLNLIMEHWQTSGLEINDYRLSPTDGYLQGILETFQQQRNSNWTNVSESKFSRRLTTLFNAYWEATSNSKDHVYGTPKDTPDSNALSDDLANTFFNTTDGEAINYNTVYHTNILWVTLLLVTTFILELLAVGGLAMDFFIRGPDVLGFASSMTRDNSHMSLPPGGTTLDGPERAAMLGNLRVQLADVCPQSDKGYIAVRQVPHTDGPDNETAEIHVDTHYRALKKKRLYS